MATDIEATPIVDDSKKVDISTIESTSKGAVSKLALKLRHLVFDKNFSTRPTDIKEHSFRYVNFGIIDTLTGYVDKQLMTNRYFKYAFDYQRHLSYHSLVANYYNHIVTAIHVMRVMHKEGSLPSRDALFLRRFLEVYPETTIPIDGVMMMFLRTIQAAEPSQQNRFSTVIPKMHLPSVSDPLTNANVHIIPNMLQYITTDWIGLHRFLKGLGKNIDYTNVFYNLVSNDAIPANEIPIHQNHNNANRRTQQFMLRPGLTFDTDMFPVNYANEWRPALQRMARQLSVPDIDLRQNIDSIESAIGFDIDPQFFGRLRQFLKPRFDYIEECRKLSDVPIGKSDHILFDPRLRPPTVYRKYNDWFNQDRDIPDSITGIHGWPTVPETGALVQRGSYSYILEHIPLANSANIPITALATFFQTNNAFLLYEDIQAFTCEENLSNEQGMEALAMRTYFPSYVPVNWRPHLPNPPTALGPYFQDTNTKWLETPVLATSQSVLHALDHSYTLGKGDNPYPI